MCEKPNEILNLKLQVQSWREEADRNRHRYQNAEAKLAELEAQVEAFREALEPFSQAAAYLPDPYFDVEEIGSLQDFNLWESVAAMNINASDLIHARAFMSALAATQRSDGPEVLALKKTEASGA